MKLEVIQLRKAISNSNSLDKDQLLSATNKIIKNEVDRNLIDICINAGILQDFFLLTNHDEHFIQECKKILYETFSLNIKSIDKAISFCLFLSTKTPKPVLIPYRKGDLWGFCDCNKNTIVEYKYIEVRLFREGLAAACFDYKWGFIDMTGNVVVPFLHDDVEDYKNGITSVQIKNDFFLYNKSGVKIPSQNIVTYNGIKASSSEQQYENATSFKDGVSKVKFKGKWGLINRSEDEVTICRYDSIDDFEESYAIVIKDKKYGFIDIDGNEIVTCMYDYAEVFSEGMAHVKLNNKWGYINKTGYQVIPCIYDAAEYFFNNVAKIELDGRWGIIDRSGNQLVPCIYRDIDHVPNELKVVVDENYMRGFINERFEEMIPCIYQDAYPFFHDTAAVKSSDKWDLIDHNGYSIANDKYDEVEYLSIGLIQVWKNKKTGIIDVAGSEIIPCEYGSIRVFGDLFRVWEGGVSGFIDMNGEKITSCKYESVREIDEGLIKVQIENYWGYIDKSGNEYWED